MIKKKKKANNGAHFTSNIIDRLFDVQWTKYPEEEDRALEIRVRNATFTDQKALRRIEANYAVKKKEKSTESRTSLRIGELRERFANG